MKPEALFDEIHANAAELWSHPLFWVPIRHHSPACARALQRLLYDVQPRMVLIEGPWDCNTLLDLLQHPDTRPPVALLSQKGEEADLYCAYFPMCDYSPEWVALKAAGDLKAEARLIDLPYDQRSDSKISERVQSLMTERYLAHSRYLKDIAQRMGCRDHFESWDRLFEQRALHQLDDWSTFFTDVYAYCDLARRDYEPEVIAAEGDAARERFMAARIGEALQETKGPIVVVTGGFHTPALAAAVTQKHKAPPPNPSPRDRNWLIRFSFDQLDSLNGYAAGMPSPAYYQSVWQQINRSVEDYLSKSAAGLLIRIAHDNRTQKLSRVISSAEVQAALFQAEQLARLRGCAGPGRSEVLDAVQSCYVKDAVTRSLTVLADARRVLCGDRLGHIPADSRQPPLVRDAWDRGRALNLDFKATQAKTLELDLYRQPRHRRISRYLYLMQWLDTGLAEWQSGPDFVNGHQLGRMREHWRYAWTPHVEARLLEQVTRGTTLDQVAVARLHTVENHLQAAGKGHRADTAAQLLIRACTMGLHQNVRPLAATIHELIEGDDQLASVVDCAHGLLTLQKGRTVLASDRLGMDLTALIRQSWRSSLFLLPRLAEIKADDAAGQLPTLSALNVLHRELDSDTGTYEDTLHQLLKNGDCPPAIRGGCLGLLFQNGRLTTGQLNEYLAVFLKVHQPAELTIGCLRGVIHVAREILWRIPAVLEHLNQLVDRWPESHFLSLLPALRMLFTDLAPKEVDAVAGQIAILNRLTDKTRLLEDQTRFSPTELALGPKLDEGVKQRIKQDQLTEWFHHASH